MALVGCGLVMTNSSSDAQRRSPVSVARLYTGSDGQTHIEMIDIKLPSTNAGGEQSVLLAGVGIQFRRFPPRWVNDWHTAPRRQYVITLSGRSEVEMAGGKKFVNNPGQVVLAEDLNGKGHITRTLGTEDWVSVAVPAPQK